MARIIDNKRGFITEVDNAPEYVKPEDRTGFVYETLRAGELKFVVPIPAKPTHIPKPLLTPGPWESQRYDAPALKSLDISTMERVFVPCRLCGKKSVDQVYIDSVCGDCRAQSLCRTQRLATERAAIAAVPRESPSANRDHVTPALQPLNLTHATESEIRRLLGPGSVLAEEIIAYRATAALPPGVGLCQCCSRKTIFGDGLIDVCLTCRSWACSSKGCARSDRGPLPRASDTQRAIAAHKVLDATLSRLEEAVQRAFFGKSQEAQDLSLSCDTTAETNATVEQTRREREHVARIREANTAMARMVLRSPPDGVTVRAHQAAILALTENATAQRYLVTGRDVECVNLALRAAGRAR